MKVIAIEKFIKINIFINFSFDDIYSSKEQFVTIKEKYLLSHAINNCQRLNKNEKIKNKEKFNIKNGFSTPSSTNNNIPTEQKRKPLTKNATALLFLVNSKISLVKMLNFVGSKP